MAETHQQLLLAPPRYGEADLSLRALEESLQHERRRQDGQVQELVELRGRNVELQTALGEEMGRLRELSRSLQHGAGARSFWGYMKDALARLPGLGGLAPSRRSIEDLLRRQYELSSLRLKEATELADRLQVSESDLYAEIDRLNERMVQSARDEEAAAAYLLQVQRMREELEVELTGAEPGSVRARTLEAEIDRTRRVQAEHTTKLQIFATAEERLERLKDSTRLLTQTVANLHGDIRQYVLVASEKLDLAAGQIQAIGAAADASVVVLELKRSLDVMTESINHTTRFVAETQLYFHEHLDRLVADLQVYDDETRALLERNVAISEVLQEERITDAVTDAMLREAEEAELVVAPVGVGSGLDGESG